MAKPPDLEKLAQQYLDLWQDQLTGIAGDTEIAQTMARTLELMNAGAQSFAGQLATLKDGGFPQAHDSKATSAAPRTSQGTAPGTQAAAPASGVANPGLDDLARRLADIEQRLARLEAKPEKPGGGPRKKSRKRKS